MKKINNYLITLLLILSASLLQSSCSTIGVAGTLELDDLIYPVSISPHLYNEKGKIVSEGNGLTKIHHWKYQKKFWGIAWSLIELTSDKDIAESMNQTIALHKGTGMVNLTIGAMSCRNFTVPILVILPIFPACNNVTIEGDIVK
jgi:hypothetical protein